MNSHVMIQWRGRLAAAGLLCLVLGTGCGDEIAPQPTEGTTPTTPQPPAGAAPSLVSDPATGFATAPTASVAYVSVRPATFPTGVRVTIQNRRTSGAVTAALVTGGLDPVPVPAEAGDTLAFAIDTGGAPPVEFTQPVPAAKRPAIVRTEPRSGKRDVPLNVRVQIIFSEPMMVGTISTVTLVLQQQGSPVAGDVEISADGLEATFLPAAALLPGTEYTVLVGDGIQDLDGSPLEESVPARFTTAASAPPPPPPQGSGVLAFATYITMGAESRANRGIAQINPNGTNFRVLTAPNAGEHDKYPAWSPGGDRIAFVRADGLGLVSEIYVVDADGSSQVRLSPAGAYDLSLTWSPDGQRIAFSHIDDPSYPVPQLIYVMNADGTNRVRLSPAGTFWNEDPAWSPDGQWIAFTSGDTVTRQIHLMKPDGSNRIRLTTQPYAYSPSWSPDGRKIAFIGVRPDGVLGWDSRDIYVMNADGTQLLALTNDSESYDPAWSPDGTRIVYRSGGGLRSFNDSLGASIYVINADGTNARRLTSPGGVTARGRHYGNSDSEPVWSPDSRWVVFTRTYGCNPMEDYVPPKCVPDELRMVALTGAVFASSRVTDGTQATWRP